MDEEKRKYFTKFIAMVVRNNMEDFHSKNLSDKQMKELNPLIRDGIYTALSVLLENKDGKYDKFIKFTTGMIPTYWEEPKLIEDL